jgi:putative solute:sodium symporter small subunit
VSRDLDEQTGLGDVYLAGLMRAQLRLTLQVLGIAALVLGGFPLLLTAVPATRTLAVLGIPLPWLVLGVAVYPAVYLLCRWYTRQAERLEDEFSDVVGPS